MKVTVALKGAPTYHGVSIKSEVRVIDPRMVALVRALAPATPFVPVKPCGRTAAAIRAISR